jgi:hypothetical protein
MTRAADSDGKAELKSVPMPELVTRSKSSLDGLGQAEAQKRLAARTARAP